MMGRRVKTKGRVFCHKGLSLAVSFFHRWHLSLGALLTRFDGERSNPAVLSVFASMSQPSRRVRENILQNPYRVSYGRLVNSTLVVPSMTPGRSIPKLAQSYIH